LSHFTLECAINKEKSRTIDVSSTAESFTFLGFSFRRMKTKSGKWGVRKTPKRESRTKLLRKLKEVFRRSRSQPIEIVISEYRARKSPGFGWKKWSKELMYDKLNLFSNYEIRYVVNQKASPTQ
jgi:RNA-directed DNA polymerase